MKSFIFFNVFLVLLLIAEIKSQARNTISTGNYELAANETGTIEISVSNDEQFSAFQFDFIIPEQFSLVDGTVSLTTRENGHDFSWELLEGNVLRIIAFSVNEYSFAGSSGAVVQFDITADTKPGDYPLSLQDVIIASGGVDILDDIIQENITLRAPEITLSPETVNFGEIPLLQQTSQNITIQNTGNSPLTISSLSVSHADYTLNDLNGFVLAANSSVSRTVTFYTTVKGLKVGAVQINSDCPANPTSSINLITDAYAVNELHLGSVKGRSGYTVTLPISINNMEPFTGFQCEIILPEQVMFVPGSEQLSSRATDHQILADTTDNKLIITAFSGSNSNFTGSDGEIASLTLFLVCNKTLLLA